MTTANEPKLAKTLLTSYDRPAALDNPRSPHRPDGGNFEKYAWIFMRLSGIFLLVLTFGHVFIMLAIDSHGVHRINSGFVAQRWSQPLWQCWDLTMLWLAQLHGGNGLRVIIDDYAKSERTKFWLKTLLVISMILVVVLGSYALLTFDPATAAAAK
jgi:succinate dehydrogenase / fumarate reductase membrane anchor subunit